MDNSRLRLIKSVVIRFKKRQNKLLIPKSELSFLEEFMKKNISDDSVIINTNIGLGVYYASEIDRSEIIKHCIIAYCQENNEKIIFLNDENFEGLKANFTQAFFTFSNYPRLFYAYVKKFVHLKSKYTHSKIVMPVLNKLFITALNELNTKGKLPFADKIKKLDPNFIPINITSISAALAEKMISKEHLN